VLLLKMLLTTILLLCAPIFFCGSVHIYKSEVYTTYEKWEQAQVLCDGMTLLCFLGVILLGDSIWRELQDE